MSRPFAAPKKLPSQERLVALLEYNKIDGSLIWKDREPDSFESTPSRSAEWRAAHWRSRYAGRAAGSRRGDGYIMCMVDGVHHLAHRIAWKIATGDDPVQIDHINGIKSDNRLENLRSVTPQINSKNRNLYSTNLSGENGVSFHARDEVWSARVSVGGGKDIHLGSFKTKEEATAARMAANIVLEYHENHGRLPGI